MFAPASDGEAPPLELSCGPVMLGGRQILAPLTLTLSERRIAVIGRNGSGKSTFLRLLAGLIEAQSGAVRVAGDNLYTERKTALREIGILFQNPDHQILFPTVVEELSFGLMQKGVARKDAMAQARAALEARGRGHWAEAPVSTLSGGQKQYLCLLALLLMAPDTLLLDEPFASLDWPAQLRLQREFANLPQRLIVITHQAVDPSDYDRVIWLERGEIRLDGAPHAVLPAFRAEMQRLAAADADTDLAL